MTGDCDKGVLLDFDFVAMDGAEALFNAANSVFDGYSLPIAFDKVAEARNFAGKNMVEAVAGHLSRAKSKRGPEKTAGMINDAFVEALAAALPSVPTGDFRGFLKTISAAGAKIVVFSRLPAADVETALAPCATMLSVHQETSPVYGAPRLSAWRRLCAKNALSELRSVAVTGSAYGLRSALLSGIPSVAVVRDHVAYQDFGGADVVSEKIDAALAKKIVKLLRL